VAADLVPLLEVAAIVEAGVAQEKGSTPEKGEEQDQQRITHTERRKILGKR
jgi:hypothetical protein